MHHLGVVGGQRREERGEAGLALLLAPLGRLLSRLGGLARRLRVADVLGRGLRKREREEIR